MLLWTKRRMHLGTFLRPVIPLWSSLGLYLSSENQSDTRQVKVQVPALLESV